MAGCSIILVLCVVMPILFAVFAIAFGTMATSLVMTIGCAAALYFLKKKGYFEKYRNDEDELKRFFAMAVKIVLILLLVINAVVFAAMSIAMIALFA